VLRQGDNNQSNHSDTEQSEFFDVHFPEVSFEIDAATMLKDGGAYNYTDVPTGERSFTRR
jgi:hypothetical protein